jgi:hypothetical protein
MARGWDSAADADSALAAYAAVTGIPVPSPVRLGRFGKIRDLEAAVWALGMAYRYPARYQGPAQDLLARVLPGPG